MAIHRCQAGYPGSSIKNETQFLSIIYDLIRLIIVDRNLIEEEAFNLKKYRSYHSWEAFKAKCLRQILHIAGKKNNFRRFSVFKMNKICCNFEKYLVISLMPPKISSLVASQNRQKENSITI